MKVKIILVSVATLLALSGCTNTMEKLSRIGETPRLAEIELPVNDDFEEDTELTLKQQAQLQHARRTNSLWQPGTTTFLKDNRTWHVGDIVKVIVEIKDSAQLDNSSAHSRNGRESLGFPNVFGQEKKIATALARGGDPENFLGLNGSRSHEGKGNISRKEDIKAEIAATVTQVLPNGNLVLRGHQEVRVNYELREVKISGIARPKDIGINNSISSNQIAEARISYGGRGQVSDVQQPRMGHQVIDIISPF
ncbi:MAG: flagellar basal body L-ring protein FlgH [Rickettsiaceae bacterium]|jgi:flagellar L-ring protein precursor FlgH|nr:flagellar basal body L-ring protein FlgH [Rickettsiaceae bacterium]